MSNVCQATQATYTPTYYTPTYYRGSAATVAVSMAAAVVALVASL
jgi:hypothetical protein